MIIKLKYHKRVTLFCHLHWSTVLYNIWGGFGENILHWVTLSYAAQPSLKSPCVCCVSLETKITRNTNSVIRVCKTMAGYFCQNISPVVETHGKKKYKKKG